jgi:hypothetical protein
VIAETGLCPKASLGVKSNPYEELFYGNPLLAAILAEEY